MMSIVDFSALREDYAAYVAHQAPYLCPRCRQARGRSGSHERWVNGGPGAETLMALIHGRCRHCHTLETLFPPWLLPYERLTVDVLNAIVDRVASQGESVTVVAAPYGLPPLVVRRRLRRWLPPAPQLRQQVLQQAAQWGIALYWGTWQPSPPARSMDWAWLALAWQALILVLPRLLGVVPQMSPGLPQWRVWAPEGLPASVVPATTHLGRRLVAARRPP